MYDDKDVDPLAEEPTPHTFATETGMVTVSPMLALILSAALKTAVIHTGGFLLSVMELVDDEEVVSGERAEALLGAITSSENADIEQISKDFGDRMVSIMQNGEL